MAERFFQLSPDHGIDDKFVLHYGMNFGQQLFPCEQIRDRDLHLGIIDNNHINLQRLMLVPKDRQVIRVTIPETGENCELRLPGKSTIICFTEGCGPGLVGEIVKGQLSGQPDRRDHLHTTTVGEAEAAGWLAFWAPLQLEGKILHCRLIAERTISSRREPTEEDARRLASVFRRAS